MKQYPSIFNDVIGPVMRGPSSSHTAASVRIGQIARQLGHNALTDVQAQFHPAGSLAATYHTQGVDIGLAGGLLGMQAQDSRLTDSLALVAQSGIDLQFHITDYAATHPNTYRLLLADQLGHQTQTTILSIGGGMIEMVELDGFAVHMDGGFYETLVYLPAAQVPECVARARKLFADRCLCDGFTCGAKGLVNVKTECPPQADVQQVLTQGLDCTRYLCLEPVLPIRSQLQPHVPFCTVEDLLAYAEQTKTTIWEAAVYYECVRGNLRPEQVLEKMGTLVDLMEGAVRQGLNGTKYEDRMLGYQSYKIQQAVAQENFLGDKMSAMILAYITAIMETKSAMGVVVAAPTAGACSGLPGTVLAVADVRQCKKEEKVQALLAGGLIGIFIAAHATFAAEVGGCQAECGSASGMTAGALVQLLHGSVKMAVDAASMALQNTFGMTCDPVAGRVEVPCLGKNIICSMNAVACANMAAAGFDAVIPLQETIESMHQVGQMLPPELRCTAKAGLAQTKTGLEIWRRLQ